MIFEWMSDPSAWVGLLTLVVLEIVLGIDNLVFIAILAEKLPPEQRRALERLDDAVKADATFTVLMGEKVEPRKEFIERNAKYAVNLDY